MDLTGILIAFPLFLILILNLETPSRIASALQRIANAMEVQNSLEAQKAGLPDPYKDRPKK